MGIIPARGGSKGVPKKNIKLLGGYPLIAYSIVLSKLSPIIERTLISTDSQEVADIAFIYGAEVPFLRPKELALDSSSDLEFIQHLLGWLTENEGNYPEYLVHLRPTTPLREPELVDQAIKKILNHTEATSLRSAHETQESPYKLFEIKNEFYHGLFPQDRRHEYYNLPRQAFPPVYHPNGYVDVIKSDVVAHSGGLHGSRILSFITPNVGELDRPEDFEYIEFIISKKKNTIHEYLKENFSI